MKTFVYQNGEYLPANAVGINVFSQTIHYGYGAFEGIRSYLTNNGVKLFKVREHLERLQLSCNRIEIPFHWDIHELIDASYKLLEINGLKNAYVRPLVTCGSGMDLKNSKQSDICILAWDWDFYNGNKLIKTCLSSFERPDPASGPVDAKITGNYMSSILATGESTKNGFDDAIQLDSRGFIAEAPGANLFMEKNGKLYTPSSSAYILSGITRATVIKIAQQLDIEVIEKDITPEEFKGADTAFLCSTAAEIVGIASIDEIEFKNSFTDSLGAIIQKAYKNLVLDKLSFEVII
jgi:branched-chain amino acid aminotransferase